ncbi:MAG: DUF58 domain-containing protein, partial [Planctomycetota bacterium]|nr:DUF58 domain-containing protein [Planctomycetota bacterium]
MSRDGSQQRSEDGLRGDQRAINPSRRKLRRRIERPRYVPWTVRYFRYLWRYKLTPAGRFLFWSVLFTSAGMATVAMPVYQIFCVLFSAYLVVWLTNLMFRPRLTVRGNLPTRVTAGELITCDIELTNDSWRPAYDLMLWLIGLQKSVRFESANTAIPRLAPGQSGILPLVLRPLRRGVYEMPDLRPHSTFPFNLMRSGSTRFPLKPLIVMPQFHVLRAIDVPVGLRYQPGGVALSSNVGESPEYIGNRDYVPGEPIRRLDFRSWARLARPVVREYQEEYYCRIALILDTWIPQRRTPPEGFPELEAAISLSASIADSLCATEHLIDIFAAGPELYVFRAGRQLAHFDNVLEILASVAACQDDPFARV